MKRIFAIVLTLVIVFLCGCGNKTPETQGKVTESEITTTDEVSFYLSIPTGSTYLTYVDDIVVRAYK